MKTRHLATAGLTVALGLFGTGVAVADTTDAPALSHEAAAGESATADITVASSGALAGESVTVLIINDDAESTDPVTDDVVFLEQYKLNDSGGTEFSVQLPTDVLESYDIALNTAAGTDRYVAPLVGEADPGEDETEEPSEDPTPNPGETTDPGEEPTTSPGESETPGGEPSESGGQGDKPTQTPDPSESAGSGGAGDEPTTGPGGSDNDGSGSGDGPGTGDSDGSGSGDDAGQSDDESGSSSDSDASGTGDDGTDQSGAGDQSSDGFLANTGASITVAILIGLVAIGLGVLLVQRRRHATESSEL